MRLTDAPCSGCPRSAPWAKGDGTTLETSAFAKAIAACNRAGGGHVVVPAGGTFLTGAIHLRSDVDLHVEGGATSGSGCSAPATTCPRR